jgi:hypothetical protein
MAMAAGAPAEAEAEMMDDMAFDSPNKVVMDKNGA